MNIKKILTVILSGAVLVTALPVLQSLAQSTETSPNVELLMVDTGESSPNLPSRCDTASQVFGWGTWVRDNIDNDNADCAKIRITNPAARYSDDFRLCFSLGNGWDETARCTAWASEGGGTIPTRTSTYDAAIGYMQSWVETRPLGGGGHLENVRVGIQWFELSDGSACGATGGMKWASETQPESTWTYGGSQDNDPGCARIAIEASYVAPYDADFEGQNVPGTLDAATTYTLPNNFQILMRNTGRTWTSETVVSQDGDCDSYEAGEDEDTDGDGDEDPNICEYTKVVTSPNIKLERIDSEPFTFTGGTPTRLSYERTITVMHRSEYVEFCEWQPGSGGGGGGGGGGDPTLEPPITKILDFFGVETAHAAPILPIDPEGGDPVCIPFSEWVEVVTQTPGTAIVTPAIGEFPLAFTTPAQPGTYNLRFRMVKTDGQAPGTDAQGFFGEEAVVPITIGNAAQGVGLTCSTQELTVQAGQTASFIVSAASQGGFAGSVQVTPTGMPAGATSPGATLTVTTSTPGSGIVPIITSSSTPAGTSTITFTATAPGITPATCTSLLIVTAGNAASLEVRPSTRQVDVGQNATYQVFYDSDGAGSQPEQDVTAAATWTINNGVGSPGAPGVFQGVTPGTATVRAAYLSLSATAALEVTGIPPGTATLEIRPASQSVNVGQTTSYTAYYDSDGSGPSLETEVSGQATWSFSGSVASSDGVGDFTGLVPGTGTVQGSYDPPGSDPAVSDTAQLTVNGGGLSCTFTANPTSLFIPPLKTTTLTWGCNQPTTCTINTVPPPSPARSIANGGQNGTATDAPSQSTTYRLNCGSGAFVRDLRVRVFDVTTRIEILPQ